MNAEQIKTRIAELDRLLQTPISDRMLYVFERARLISELKRLSDLA